MKDLKIRAWYEPSAHMYYNIYMKPSYCGNQFIKYEWYAMSFNNSFEMKLSNRYVYLMGSSGLTDKCNEEIYEGDIVEFNSRIGYIKWDYNKAMFVIITRDKNLIGYLNSYIASRCRIIGDIFNNMKLLYKNMQ
ncbi:YopX family protein [Clostridium oryzae]|uniref:YopX protein n=1 Tax=Clostridium oryzae TaxID=1450648 RepID=A0A1V4IHX7_9CLOT|nr:YopX family protein [Clostridium oryzae]OPJ59117.1 YopX protein [Clostridium oryzae]